MDDDIEAMIKAAKEMRDDESRRPFLNSAADLPASKRKLKFAIKERVRMLYGAYIALASFVSEDDAMLFWDEEITEKKKRILKRVLRDMDKNRKELEEFDPFAE